MTAAPRATRPFRLLRYFTLTGLAAILALSAALYGLERAEEAFLERLQERQGQMVAASRQALAEAQDREARARLVAAHEAGHVTLSRVFANVLWQAALAPFLDRAAALEPCPATDRDCAARLGRRLLALPGFATLDARAHEAMGRTAVFKIKVFDLRGVTVYSSDHAQVGELKADNRGWQAAAAGRAASELTHRDRFSTFEGVVENRDLISSYVPLRAPGGDRVLGVFEIYSDVTPLLDQLREASARLQELSAADQRSLEESARENRRRVGANSDRVLGLMAGLLLLFYAVLWLFTRNAQQLLDRQAVAQEQARHREANWHREKMAALAAMADNICHEVGNPLATIAGLAEDIDAQRLECRCAACRPREILDQVERIAAMTRQMAAFAAAQGERPDWVDLNAQTKALCELLGFDRRFGGRPLAFAPAADLPACHVSPDRLNEALTGALLGILEAGADRSDRREPVAVATALEQNRILIRIASPYPVAGPLAAERLAQVHHQVEAMGGSFRQAGDTLEIALAVAPMGAA